jgi:hypothetical protein
LTPIRHAIIAITPLRLLRAGWHDIIDRYYCHAAYDIATPLFRFSSIFYDIIATPIFAFITLSFRHW